jgi:hypothetical protein
LQPLASQVVMSASRAHKKAFYKALLPEIERRLRNYDSKAAKSGAEDLDAEPNDFLQWSINQTKESADPRMYHPEILTDRLLLLGMATLISSSFVMTNAILDLVSIQSETVQELREGVIRVLAESNGKREKRALAKMHKLDYSLSESMRMNAFMTLGISRTVVAKDGITTP